MLNDVRGEEKVKRETEHPGFCCFKGFSWSESEELVKFHGGGSLPQQIQASTVRRQLAFTT